MKLLSILICPKMPFQFLFFFTGLFAIVVLIANLLWANKVTGYFKSKDVFETTKYRITNYKDGESTHDKIHEFLKTKKYDLRNKNRTSNYSAILDRVGGSDLWGGISISELDTKILIIYVSCTGLNGYSRTEYPFTIEYLHRRFKYADSLIKELSGDLILNKITHDFDILTSDGPCTLESEKDIPLFTAHVDFRNKLFVPHLEKLYIKRCIGFVRPILILITRNKLNFLLFGVLGFLGLICFCIYFLPLCAPYKPYLDFLIIIIPIYAVVIGGFSYFKRRPSKKDTEIIER